MSQQLRRKVALSTGAGFGMDIPVARPARDPCETRPLSVTKDAAIAPGVVLNDLWGISDPAEIDRKAADGEGLRSEDVADAALFMLTRPRNVTIRDLVILPRAQQI